MTGVEHGTSAADPRPGGPSLTRAGGLPRVYLHPSPSRRGRRQVRPLRGRGRAARGLKASVNKALSSSRRWEWSFRAATAGWSSPRRRGLCQGGLALPQGAAHLPGARPRREAEVADEEACLMEHVKISRGPCRGSLVTWSAPGRRDSQGLATIPPMTCCFIRHWLGFAHERRAM